MHIYIKKWKKFNFSKFSKSKFSKKSFFSKNFHLLQNASKIDSGSPWSSKNLWKIAETHLSATNINCKTKWICMNSFRSSECLNGQNFFQNKVKSHHIRILMTWTGSQASTFACRCLLWLSIVSQLLIALCFMSQNVLDMFLATFHRP